MNTGWKKALKIVLCALLVLVLAVGGYVAYVFLAYYRLEDNLPLAVEVTGSGINSALTTGETYRVVSLYGDKIFEKPGHSGTGRGNGGKPAEKGGKQPKSRRESLILKIHSQLCCPKRR